MTVPDSEDPLRASGPLETGSEAYARAIVETIRQPLLVLDDRFRVLSANPAFYRHFRVDPSDVEGTELWALGNGQWDGPALRRLLTRVLETHEPVEDFEVRHEFESIGWREFLINARQVAREGTEYQLLLIAFEDVTERRRAERALREHTRQLERSNRDLEEFAHAASHDLQEPLRKVRTFADRFVASVETASLDDRQRLYLERMQDGAARMQKRIDDLLGLARVTRRQPDRESIDLNDAVDAAIAALETPIAEANATIEVGELPRIEADQAHMELLFQNLLSNAIKYRRPDVPPVVRVEGGPAQASDPHEQRPMVRILFSDNGIGFEQEYADRIFRPFERLHGRSEYEGTGVGLSICRRVVELHDGTISATSSPGEGATFEVRLPTVHRSREE